MVCCFRGVSSQNSSKTSMHRKKLKGKPTLAASLTPKWKKQILLLLLFSTLLFIQFQPSYKALFSYTLLSLPYIKFSSSVLFPISVLKTFKSFPSSKENKTWPTQNKTSSLIHIAFQPARFFFLSPSQTQFFRDNSLPPLFSFLPYQECSCQGLL